MTEETRKRVKLIFDEYVDLLESRATLNEQLRDLISEAAELSGKKKTLVRKAFSFLQKKIEDGDDQLEDIVIISEELSG